MGLESVELIMTIENKFGISIPDAECENIATVQHMADSVFEKITLKPNIKCISQIVFYRIRQALELFGNNRIQITPNTRLSELLSRTNLKNDWSRLRQRIDLRIPDLVYLDLNTSQSKEVRFLGFKLYNRTEPVADNTIRKFTDWVISMNYSELISLETISTKYEIERIVCGIIENTIGIPISEIELSHAFTNDLGID